MNAPCLTQEVSGVYDEMDEKEFAVAGKSVLSANFVGIGASGYRPAVNLSLPFAQVAELADALDSGSSVRKDVEVRILSWAPNI